ncbi:MAG: hypothetical protein ACLFTK_11405 [Anaerolineales bacterium]
MSYRRRPYQGNRSQSRQQKQRAIQRGQRYEPGCLPLDMLRGLSFFSARASCYMLAVIGVVVLPLVICGLLLALGLL